MKGKAVMSVFGKHRGRWSCR